LDFGPQTGLNGILRRNTSGFTHWSLLSSYCRAGDTDWTS
jgi:hypothetical protein